MLVVSLDVISNMLDLLLKMLCAVGHCARHHNHIATFNAEELERGTAIHEQPLGEQEEGPICRYGESNSIAIWLNRRVFSKCSRNQRSRSSSLGCSQKTASSYASDMRLKSR